jgi:hypothetical protein
LKNPQERYQDVGEFLESLVHIQHGRTGSTGLTSRHSKRLKVNMVEVLSLQE